jgi:NADPH2:quinone reductase
MLLVYLLTEAQRQRACGLIGAALEAGVLRHHIGARYALGDTAQAHVAVESGSVIGNVVVSIS